MISISWLNGDARRLTRAAQGTLAAGFLAACSPPPSVPPKVAAAPGPELLAEGAAIYEQSCAMCHFAGENSLSAPPLVGSPMVRDDPGMVITVTLHGIQNTSVVNGKKFGGIMPPTAGLTDDEVAAVVTFVRERYGGVKEITTPAEVAARR